MKKEDFEWISKGMSDFLKITFVGTVFILVSYFTIPGMVNLGMHPSYASTVISLCLIFAGSMMFSYFEYKNSCNQTEKQILIEEALRRRKERKAKQNKSN